MSQRNLFLWYICTIGCSHWGEREAPLCMPIWYSQQVSGREWKGCTLSLRVRSLPAQGHYLLRWFENSYAHHYFGPITINWNNCFIVEFDCLASARGNSEDGAISRRLLSEMLLQLTYQNKRFPASKYILKSFRVEVPYFILILCI